MVNRTFLAAVVVAAASASGTATAQPHGRHPNATAQPTGADPTMLEARQRYDEGRAHFDAGRYAEALVAFQRAYALRSNAIVLVPIAECQERLGQVPAAIATVERYLRERPDAADRAQLEARLTALRSRPATVHVATNPPGARIRVDGRDAQRVTPADVTVPPGRHVVSAELAGYSATERPVDLEPGTTLNAEVALAQIARSPAPPTPPVQPPTTTAPGSRGSGAAVWVAGGVAGVSLVAGTVFGLMALSDSNEFAQTNAPTRELLDRGQRNALLADLGFAAAVLSATVAVVLYLSDRGTTAETAPAPARARRSPRPGLGLGPGGLAVQF